MKTISLAMVTCFLSVILIGQDNDLKLEFKLRFENQKIFCDVVPGEDYLIACMQFGIDHNSDFVIFDTAYSQVLDFENMYNEVCPRKVRFVWTSQNTLLLKNIPFLTLEYTELIQANHFICMMPSKLTKSCSTMIREACYFFGDSLLRYNIQDVCVDYRIQYGAIVLSNEDKNKMPVYQVHYNYTNRSLQLDPMLINQNCKIRVNDLRGNEQNLFNGNYQGQELILNEFAAGIYFYSILVNNYQVINGKLLVFK